MRLPRIILVFTGCALALAGAATITCAIVGPVVSGRTPASIGWLIVGSLIIVVAAIVMFVDHQLPSPDQRSS